MNRDQKAAAGWVVLRVGFIGLCLVTAAIDAYEQWWALCAIMILGAILKVATWPLS